MCCSAVIQQNIAQYFSDVGSIAIHRLQFIFECLHILFDVPICSWMIRCTSFMDNNMAIAGWKEQINDGKAVIVVFWNSAKETTGNGDRRRRDKLVRELSSWQKATNQIQRRSFNDGVSTMRMVDIGIPQGSCPASILFILYINDLNRALYEAEANLFADDTAVALADSNIGRAINRMNVELDGLFKWLCENKLKVNLGKTKYMIIGN